MDINKLLAELGLSESESRVYLASLEVGEAGLTTVATRANMAPMTTKYLLQKLHEKNCVTAVKKNKRFLYIPYPPAKLLSNLRTQRRQLEKTINKFEDALPELNRHISFGHFAPKVRFFAHDEIRMIYEEILEQPIDMIYWIGDVKKIQNAIGTEYLEDWMIRRVKKKIATRVIRVPAGEVYTPAYTGEQTLLRKIKHTPVGFEAPSHIIIYGDNVAFITTKKEAFGTVITSREVATTMRSCWQETWKNSLPFKRRWPGEIKPGGATGPTRC